MNDTKKRRYMYPLVWLVSGNILAWYLLLNGGYSHYMQPLIRIRGDILPFLIFGMAAVTGLVAYRQLGLFNRLVLLLLLGLTGFGMGLVIMLIYATSIDGNTHGGLIGW